MEKNVFYYQRYMLRCLMILPVVILALAAEYLLSTKWSL